MTGQLTPTLFLLLAFCIVTDAGREICFKGASQSKNFIHSLKKPLFWVGICLWGVELIAWTNVLEKLSLSIAFPFMSLVYVVVVFGGAVIFKEKINLRHAAGACFITLGVILIGATGS